MYEEKINPLIDIIAGARPNFVKIAAIFKVLTDKKSKYPALRYRLIHTGQHYDADMSDIFFQQLGIPEPDANLNVGSGTQASQTAAIMLGYEQLLIEEQSTLCLVVGDVTSTMACAITAQKLGIPVAHVEAGIRSEDWSMPEEINRIVTDAVTNIFFTTSEYANKNLRLSGVPEDRIIFVGNTMINTLYDNLDRLKPPIFWDDAKLQSGEYFVITLHRPSNVDDFEKTIEILKEIEKHARGNQILFPVHPRTAKNIRQFDSLNSGIIMVDPLPYLEFNYLIKHAKAVITDSGGVSEETTVFGVPCLTLRNTTERPETIIEGTNELIGTDPKNIKQAFERVFTGMWKKGSIPEKWDDQVGQRIVRALEQMLYSSK